MTTVEAIGRFDRHEIDDRTSGAGFAVPQDWNAHGASQVSEARAAQVLGYVAMELRNQRSSAIADSP